MPLKSGKKNIPYNIREMMKAGYSCDVAVAAAMNASKKRKKKR